MQYYRHNEWNELLREIHEQQVDRLLEEDANVRRVWCESQGIDVAGVFRLIAEAAADKIKTLEFTPDELKGVPQAFIDHMKDPRKTWPTMFKMRRLDLNDNPTGPEVEMYLITPQNYAMPIQSANKQVRRTGVYVGSDNQSPIFVYREQ